MPPPLLSAAAFGVSYRAMRDGDLPFVERLYASTRADEVAQTGWPAEIQAAFLRQQHEAQHRHYRANYVHAEWLIIERGGEAIGRLYLDRGEDALAIVDISLVPHARGTGIGGAILRDVLAMAAGHDRAVDIHVEINNPARRLYDRLGFAVTEHLGIYDRMRAVPAKPS